MSTTLRRALACALSASMALTPCTAAFAQKKGDPKAAKADAKTDAKADKKKPPTKAEKAKAKAAFQLGNDKFKAGEFAAAADAFREANSVIPTPQALYRIALSLDKAGKGADALAAYRTFLDAPPPDAMAEQKGAAEARFKELNVGTIKLSSAPDGASVNVDGQPAAGPTPLTLSLKPGPHTIEVSAPKFEPSTRELVVVGGSTVDVNVPLKELPPPPPPPAPVEPVASAPVATEPPPPPPKPEPPPSKVPAYVTLGLAGAGLVVGTVFGVKALSSKSDFDSKPTTDNADAAERNALIADMAFGVAVTLGITGTVLLLSSNKKAEPPKTGKLRFMPLVSPQVQGAAAVFRF